MRFPRTLTRVLGCVVVIIGLAGCGGQASVVESQSALSAEDKVKQIQADSRIPAEAKAQIIAQQQAMERDAKQNSSKP